MLTSSITDTRHASSECLICGGTGWISYDVPVGHPNFGKAFRCTCQLDELQSRQLDRLRRLSNMHHLERMTFDSFIPDGHGLSDRQRQSLRLAFDRAFTFARKPQGWLLLRGGYGCGKTHLAAAIANECLSRGRPVLFVNVPDLLDHLRSTYGPSSEVSFDERFEEIRDAPVLILDDLGTQNATPWAQEKLYQIFNHRYNAQLPTVVTTNQDLEDIDPRLRSRLLDVGFVEQVRILAPDFRGMGIDQAKPELSSFHLRLYEDKTFHTFKLRTGELDLEDAHNLKRALELAQDYAREPRDWLVFIGTYGCGKTHLAAAIANELSLKGYPVMFIGVPDLLDHLKSAYAPQSPVRYDERFNQIRTAPTLILDDLGTENATSWAREKLYQIVNHRYVTRLPTVITTAWAIEELDPKIAARILDPSRCTTFAILAPSYYGGKFANEKNKPAADKGGPSTYQRKSSTSRRGR